MQWTNPQTFTLEAWVKTTTTRSGLILGFANVATGAAATIDEVAVYPTVLTSTRIAGHYLAR